VDANKIVDGPEFPIAVQPGKFIAGLYRT
jgi:hypothetical protein